MAKTVATFIHSDGSEGEHLINIRQIVFAKKAFEPSGFRDQPDKEFVRVVMADGSNIALNMKFADFHAVLKKRDATT
jgi:hypothetical protein